METVYDWVTVAIFAGLIVLYLQRSMQEDEAPQDSIWHYLAPSVGCALANYLGNETYHLPAILVILAVLGYTYFVLRPQDALTGPRG